MPATRQSTAPPTRSASGLNVSSPPASTASSLVKIGDECPAHESSAKASEGFPTRAKPISSLRDGSSNDPTPVTSTIESEQRPPPKDVNPPNGTSRDWETFNLITDPETNWSEWKVEVRREWGE